MNDAMTDSNLIPLFCLKWHSPQGSIEISNQILQSPGQSTKLSPGMNTRVDRIENCLFVKATPSYCTDEPLKIGGKAPSTAKTVLYLIPISQWQKCKWMSRIMQFLVYRLVIVDSSVHSKLIIHVMTSTCHIVHDVSLIECDVSLTR